MREFMVDMPAEEVLRRTEAEYARAGYGIRNATETTRLFAGPSPGCLTDLLTLFTARAPIVQFVATDEGGGRCRFTVQSNKRDREKYAAEWVRELGGTPL